MRTTRERWSFFLQTCEVGTATSLETELLGQACPEVYPILDCQL